MFQNYLKTALRNIRMNTSFSTINIAGLSLGMACSLLILLWVSDEWRRDVPPANAERLYAAADYFGMFGYPLLEGSVAGALSGPLNLAIPRKMAVGSLGVRLRRWGRRCGWTTGRISGQVRFSRICPPMSAIDSSA